MIHENHQHSLTVGGRIGIANSNRYGSVDCFLTNDSGDRFILTCAHILRKINYLKDNTVVYYPDRKMTQKKSSQLVQHVDNVFYCSDHTTELSDYALIQLDTQISIQLQVAHSAVWKICK